MGIPFPQAHRRCDSDAFIDALIPGEFSFLYRSGRIIYHIVHTNVLSSTYIGKNFLSPRCPSVQLSSVALLWSTLCDPMDCSRQGFPVHYRLPELAQTHVHQVSDAIQPSHSLSSPSFAFSLSQHQGLFKWVSSSHHGGQSIGASASASVLPMNIQDWFPLGWTGWISLQSKGLSRVFSNTTAQKHQFFGAQLSLWPNSHIHRWLLEIPYLWLHGPLPAE